MTFTFPGLVDLRGELPAPLTKTTATGAAQLRRAATNTLVLHYNGPIAPARAGGTRSQIAGWLREVIIPNHISRIGADGVQYHFWIGADGTLYQLRDLDMLLWHCGNLDANSRSLAVHVPIGGNQQPTAAQWQTFTALAHTFCDQAHVGRQAIKGHCEYGFSACPGPILLPLLSTWRDHAPGAGAITADAPLLAAPGAAADVVAARFVAAMLRTPSPRYTAADVSTTIIPAYWRLCVAVGLDPLLAVAQLAHETGYLSSDWCARPHRNPAGIGVTGEAGAGASFATWADDAIPAHVGRLLAYALVDGNAVQRACIAQALAVRPLSARYRGIAPTLRGLGGTWAVPGWGYAAKLAAIATALRD